MTLAEVSAMLSLPFMTRSLTAIIVLSLVGAVIGVIINLRNLEFISDGLAHSVFPGLVIGYVAAGTDGLLVGALIAALIAAVLLTFIERRGVGSDAGIAVVLASMFSLGIVLVSREDSYVSQLEQLLFGHLLTVTDTQLRQIIIVSAVALVLVLATWRGQIFHAFDASGFRAAGYPSLAYDLTLNSAVALVVVAGSQAIGNLLVLALLIIPAAIARLITRRLGWLAPIAGLASALSGIVGLVVSYQGSIVYGVSASPSATVVLVLIALYLLVLGGYSGLRWWGLRRSVPSHEAGGAIA